jgi:hypothetical protein
LAIKSAKHGAYDSLLAGGSAQEVVQDVRNDYGVNHALKLLHLEAKIEVWQFGCHLGVYHIEV